MVREVAPKLLSWASDIEPATVEQAARAARLPFVAGHVALMPDAHVGIGATVGSVIPTKGAVIPAAVGVDIGCGMVATETDLTAADLPDSLSVLMPLIKKRVPAGVGKGHDSIVDTRALDEVGLPAGTELSAKQRTTVGLQFGTLGSGNHFVEVCLDERDVVWILLHSGSRGIGNQLAQRHIDRAKGAMKQLDVHLEDANLAYFVQGRPEFDSYIADMMWAQRYALASRAVMARRTTQSLFDVVGKGAVRRVVNTHHNFTQLETHS